MLYEAPSAVEDAISILKAAPVGCKPVAGGTDLLVQIRATGEYPEVFLDLKHIPELIGIDKSNGTFRIGAATPCAQITRHPGLGESFPGLVEAAELIGSVQIQSRCSLGGNLCNGSPAADTVPALIVLGATAVIAGPAGERSVPVEGFVTGPGKTVLQSGEIVVAIEVDELPSGSADAYLRFTPRAEMDIAVVGSGVRLTVDPDGVCTAAYVCLGAVGPTQITVPAAAAALVGSKLEDPALAEAGRKAKEAARPITDHRGTVEYRKHLAEVLTVRGLRIARQRVQNR